MSTLLLVEVPDDPDGDPPEQWLMRLPEMEGATLIWHRHDEDGGARKGHTIMAIGDIRDQTAFTCGVCSMPIVGTAKGWMHKDEWQRRMR